MTSRKRLIEIEERWEKMNGVVCYCYRIVPDTEWIIRETPYKEIPVVVMNLRSSEEEI